MKTCPQMGLTNMHPAMVEFKSRERIGYTQPRANWYKCSSIYLWPEDLLIIVDDEDNKQRESKK